MLARIDYVARIVHSSFMRQVIGAQEAVDRLRDAASARTTRPPLRPLLGRRIALQGHLTGRNRKAPVQIPLPMWPR